MGNKSSKKTETSTAVAKHNFNTPYKTTASIKPTAQVQQHNGTEWMMVVNATAYVRYGSQNNVGAQTNVAASKVYAVPQSNALTSCSKNAKSIVVAKQISQRKDVAVGTEALHFEESRNDKTLKISTVAAAKSTTIASAREIKSCTLKVANALNYQGSNKISQQNFCAVNHNTVASKLQQNSSSAKITATATATNENKTVTVYNSNLSKTQVETLVVPNKGYDWFNTMTVKAKDGNQPAVGYVHKEPPDCQEKNKQQVAKDTELQAGDARAQESFMWRQVNSAERGCWFHFRRAGGGFRCTLCGVFLRGPQSVIEHAWGKFHQNKLARRRMYETDENLMWRQVPNPLKLHRNYIHKKTADQKPFFYCSICHVEVPFVYQNLLTHIQGRNHFEEVKKQQCN